MRELVIGEGKWYMCRSTYWIFASEVAIMEVALSYHVDLDEFSAVIPLKSCEEMLRRIR